MSIYAGLLYYSSVVIGYFLLGVVTESIVKKKAEGQLLLDPLKYLNFFLFVPALFSVIYRRMLIHITKCVL